MTNKIVMGVSMPYAGDIWPAGEGVAPALLKAVEEINSNEDILPNHELQFFWFDTQCDINYAPLAKMVKKLYEPHVFIGPACSTVVKAVVEDFNDPLDPVNFDIPLISWGAGNAAFADKDVYPMFSRVVAAYGGHNSAVVHLAKEFGWDGIGIIATSDSLFGTTQTLLMNELNNNIEDITIAPLTVNEDSYEVSDTSSVFNNMKEKNIRALVVLGYCGPMKKWVADAKDNNMLEGYAILAYDWGEACLTDDDTAVGIKDFTGVWSLTAKAPSNPDFLASIDGNANFDFSPYLEFPFGTATPKDGADPVPFQNAMSNDARTFVVGNSVPDNYAMFMYDAVMLFAKSAHNMLSDTDTDWFDGTSSISLNFMNQYIRGNRIEGESGTIELDSLGERSLPIEITTVKATNTPSFRNDPLADFDPTFDEISWSLEAPDRVWPGNVVGGDAPGLDGSVSTETIGGGEEGGAGGGEGQMSMFVALGAVAFAIALALYYRKAYHQTNKKLSDNSVVMPIIRKLSSSGPSGAAVPKSRNDPPMPKTKKKCKPEKLAIFEDNLLIDYDSLYFERDKKGDRLVIGKGAFGNVLVATYMGSRCAVKELKTEIVDDMQMLRFKDEVKLMIELRHPCIVQCLGVCWEDPNFCQVCELCPLGGLDKFLLKNGDFTTWTKTKEARKKALRYINSQNDGDSDEDDEDDDEQEKRQILLTNCLGLKWKIALEVAQGMFYLHSQRIPILHRDLKCANVLLSSGYNAKITDFGESREADGSEEQMTETGTPYFMAPEVMVGDEGGSYDKSVDIYSFGVLLLEMYVDGHIKHAFNNLGPVVVMNRVTKGWRPPLGLGTGVGTGKGVGMDVYMPELSAIVERCWAHNPADRPSFGEVVKMIEAARDQGSEFAENLGFLNPSSKNEEDNRKKSHSAPNTLNTTGLESSDSYNKGATTMVHAPASTISVEEADKNDAVVKKIMNDRSSIRGSIRG